MAIDGSYFDVCIFCAMAEEAEAVIKVFSRQCKVRFEQAFSRRTNREYRHAIIRNNKGESLSIHVSWPLKFGPLEAGLQLKPVLEEFQPRFAAMTGICAGDRRKVKLGDLVVAERAFAYDTGKYMLDEDGQQVHLHDADPRHPDPNVLQYARMFNTWKPAVARLKRPPTKRQQRDWLLSKLSEEATPRVDDIQPSELAVHAPEWKRIMQELQAGLDPYLTKERVLRDKSKVLELRFGSDEFPFRDPPSAACYIAPMASGSAVRSDNPFQEVQVSVRGTIAVDMEGAAFYRTVADFPAIRSLLVKGVSDYADLDKDDSYHKYAAEVSSMYILCFIKEYVTVDRMPRMHGVQQLPQSVVDESGEARKTRTSVLGMVKDGVQPNKALQPALLHKPFMTGDLSPEFVMRSIVHEQIVTAISDRPADTQPLHIIALTGAGGFGKTTLARQVCHDRRIRAMFPDGILWVTLGQEPFNPIGHIQDIVQALIGQRPTFAGVDAAVALFVELVTGRNILLVIDDVWNAADLAPFIQGGTQLVRLVTARDSTVLPLQAQRVNVPTMRDDEAMQMLQMDLPEGDPARLMHLIHLYGNWPLGVSFMHGVIYNRVRLLGQPLSDALTFIQQMIETRGLRAFDAHNARARHQAIRITMDLSLDLLSAVDRSCFMSLAIFPAEIDIPLATVAHWWHTYAGYDSVLTEALAERLAQMSLLGRFDPVRRSIRIHEVIHNYLEDQQRTESPSLHAQFLEGYALQSWANLAPEELYLWWALRYHLIRAQRINTFILIIRAFAGPSSRAAGPGERTGLMVSPTGRGSAVESDLRTRHGAVPSLHRSRQ